MTSRTYYNEASFKYFDMPLDPETDSTNYHLGTLAANLYRFIRQTGAEGSARFEPRPDDRNKGLRLPTEKGLNPRVAICSDEATWLIDARLPEPKKVRAESQERSAVALAEASERTIQVVDFVGILHTPRSESSGPHLELSSLGIEEYTTDHTVTSTLGIEVNNPDARPDKTLEIASAAALTLCVDYDQMRHLWRIT